MYAFISEGPKGEIEKIVSFDLISDRIYNLGLADRKGDILEDMELSNNHDIFKIFNTIAEIFTDFTKAFNNASIFFEGNTISKNIIYGRSLGNRLLKMEQLGFNVQGYIHGKWEWYKKGQNYDAFLLKKD